MMNGKAQAVIIKADMIADNIENSGLLGTSIEEEMSNVDDPYNNPSSQTTEEAPQLGLSDCWPACKAITGDVSNNANFGFHA